MSIVDDDAVDRTVPDAGTVLSDDHVDELTRSAIPLQVALDAGVYSARCHDELPAWAQWIAAHDEDVFPVLVYPMVQPDGSETGQVKPALGTVTFDDGRAPKYISPGKHGNPPRLPVLRAVKDPETVLIVEGVKQALAALAWAPPAWSIYRITGIWSWMVASGVEGQRGTPTPHLAAVQGRDVVIVPDADARTNPHVFDGATALGEACEGYGANSVRFARLPGGGKDGLDDLLARLADDDARRSMLRSWVANAKQKPADLDKRELSKLRSEAAAKAAARAAEVAVADAARGRVEIDVSGDMLQVSLDMLEALVEAKGGTRVFQRDGAMVRVRPDHTGRNQAGLLTRSGLRRELLEAVYPCTMTADGPAPAGLSDNLVDLVADHYDRMPWLAGITRSPLVAADGSVRTASGYDPQTGVLLDLTPDVQGIEVPEHPTDADIEESVELIRDDLFARDGAGGRDGWVFASEADQTHAIAGLITPVVRANVRKVPMLVFDGLHRGVGKGGCVDVIHRVAFGIPAPMQPAPKSDEEMDKRLIAKLRAGADTIVLDEVQDKDGTSRLDSLSLGAFLTSESYEGRKLGVSEILDLPNMATTFGLGNNVQIPGDMIRRVYTSRLSSDRDDLETRDDFRHDMDTWVPEHRAELLRAVLILVRAWYDRGQPEAPRAFGFKSFGEWQRVVGGILHLAGIKGFLSTVLEVRATADSEAVDNAECWAWISDLFPAGARFAAGDVLAQAKADPDAPPPYGKGWDELDAKSLSTYFGTHPRWYGGLRVRHDGKMHGRGKAYVVEQLPAGVTPLPVPDPTTSSSAPAGQRPAAGATKGEVIEITDRHGFKSQVARAMPPMNGKTIAEIGGDAS
ncbi:hypothetical protein GCM10027416_11460 [Okibacterium endophyticum]